MLLNLNQAIQRYGPIENGIWQNESQFMVLHPIIKFPWNFEGSEVVHIYMNKDMVQAFDLACNNLINNDLINNLITFDGCFYIRNVRGYSDISTHSYGLAIDINAKQNPLGGPVSFSKDFVKCFTDAGFIWGGDFKTRIDPMHFQFADW